MRSFAFIGAIASTVISVAFATPAAATRYVLLHSFREKGASQAPIGGLLEDGGGSLYGTTCGHKAFGGTAFELVPTSGSWVWKQLYQFHDTDGSCPEAALIQDSSGALYGTTVFGPGSGCGGTGCGTVFQLAQTNGVWSETVLHDFTGGSDGALPFSGLIEDTAGALYGTANQGGAYNAGTVFQLAQTNGVWSETVLHNFTGGSDGGLPYSGLIGDSAGTFYGTTSGGGSGNGVVFALTQTGGVWTETVLYSFASKNNSGLGPYGGLVEDSGGALYGTTFGGDQSCRCGSVFELTESNGNWSETVLHTFRGQLDGGNPMGTLYMDATGALYGTAETYGQYNAGVFFKLTPTLDHWKFSALHQFGSGSDGSFSESGPIQDPKTGKLYGTTSGGGAHGGGTVYKIKP